MKKLHTIALYGVVAISVASCSSPVTKRVLVMGRGEVKANGNDITMKDGTGYVEQLVDVNDKNTAYNVTSPAGKTTINIPPDAGLYILNLRKDTVVGAKQDLGSDLGGRTMTQEELKVKIDSLIQLTKGTNVSEARHNFMVTPNQLTKISANMDAKVFGPFTKIPGTLDADKDGKAPELYKFYTNNEVRDIIVSLKKNTF